MEWGVRQHFLHTLHLWFDFFLWASLSFIISSPVTFSVVTDLFGLGSIWITGFFQRKQAHSLGFIQKTKLSLPVGGSDILAISRWPALLIDGFRISGSLGNRLFHCTWGTVFLTVLSFISSIIMRGGKNYLITFSSAFVSSYSSFQRCVWCFTFGCSACSSFYMKFLCKCLSLVSRMPRKINVWYWMRVLQRNRAYGLSVSV